ncbi:hypothetical protein H5410_001616, partial [Solanum commersonii]
MVSLLKSQFLSVLRGLPSTPPTHWISANGMVCSDFHLFQKAYALAPGFPRDAPSVLYLTHSIGGISHSALVNLITALHCCNSFTISGQ